MAEAPQNSAPADGVIATPPASPESLATPAPPAPPTPAPPPPVARTLVIEPSPQPWLGLDMRNADVVIELFLRAAELNRGSKLRKGSTIHLPAAGRLLMTGDLHDHNPNLVKIVKLAALTEGSDRHVIIHEVIHGEQFVNGMDLSIRILAKVAALKIAFPEQVHFLQSNHELAQYRGDGILKGNVSVCEVFDQGVDYIYGDRAGDVRQAAKAFIRSYPLAARAAKGILFVHSLPGVRQLEKFDPTILDRDTTEADLEPGGHGYVLCWGRYQSQELCDKLAAAWGVDLFIAGHQPAEMGYEMMTRTLMILASNHEHAMVLPLDLSKKYDMDKLMESLVPLAAVI